MLPEACSDHGCATATTTNNEVRIENHTIVLVQPQQASGHGLVVQELGATQPTSVTVLVKDSLFKREA